METDRYGRAVAKVIREPDGLVVNAEMVKSGHAWVYRRYTRDPALLRRLDLENLTELEEALGYTVGMTVADKDGLSAALIFAEMAAALLCEEDPG